VRAYARVGMSYLCLCAESLLGYVADMRGRAPVYVRGLKTILQSIHCKIYGVLYYIHLRRACL
jgi:hypothetical protein